MTATRRFAPVSYRRASLGEHYDAIIIGSGVGALAAAVLLTKRGGKRVLVLERHYTAGGFTHTFSRPGFDWDVGVHYIGQVQDPSAATRRIFDYLTDGQLQWASMPDVYDRVLVADRTFDFPAGIERYRESMKACFPQDIRGIDQYIQAVNHCAGKAAPFFAEKILPPFLTKMIGPVLRSPYMRYARRTTADILARSRTIRCSSAS
jgi:all-trans-retinol 13,14-reductase